MTHLSPKRNMVPKAVLMSGKNVNTARPKAVVNAARPKVVLNAVKGNQVNAVKALAFWVWKPNTKGNPQMDLQDQGVIDSGCSRHITGNMPYLIDFEEIDRGYVTFGDDYSRFSWVFFLATKDETSAILKSFITGVENLIDQRVKVIRCDNGTEFKNKEMNQFCERKGINREFSLARPPQQNRVAERKKRTLIEAARTMLADSKLPTTFWAETVNTGSGPNWLFDIDALTKSMNYKPVVAGNQSNGNAGTKACDDAGKMETVPGKDYILLPLWPADPLFSQSSKSSPDAEFKPSGDDEKKVTEEPGKEGGDSSKEDESNDQEKDDNVNSTNNVNAASTNEVNAVGRKSSIELPDDPNMPELEDIVYSDDDEDVGTEADMNNLDAFMPVSPIQTTRIHKDHPVKTNVGLLITACELDDVQQVFEMEWLPIEILLIS
ncbi:putative ribonuclease H-like domain-containing protein [Tanacetum coccineum]